MGIVIRDWGFCDYRLMISIVFRHSRRPVGQLYFFRRQLIRRELGPALRYLGANKLGIRLTWRVELGTSQTLDPFVEGLVLSLHLVAWSLE
jgi:hypothetical protein